MPDTPDLAPWLLEQIAEDERKARDAGGRAWHWSADTKRAYPQRVFETGTMVLHAETYVDPDDTAGTPEHIATWDPARVLAECEAKRRVIERHCANGEGDLCATCREVGPDAQGWPCDTLRLLALPHADRPGYDEEWRP